MIGLNILSEMIKFSYIPHEKQPDTKASTTEDINNKATEDSNGQSFDVASSIRRDQFSKNETTYIPHEKQPNTEASTTEDINSQSTIQDNKNAEIQREFDHLTQYVQTNHQAILDEITRVHQKIKTILKI